MGKWAWESEKVKVVRVCRGKHWTQSEQHRDNPEHCRGSLQLSPDECRYVRKLYKAETNATFPPGKHSQQAGKEDLNLIMSICEKTHLITNIILNGES